MKRPRYAALVMILCLPALAGCQSTTAAPEEQVASPLLDTLGEGWNPVEPGGDTICSDGSDFRFFVRVADPRELVVYFQGGGACWNGGSCDPDGDPTYTQVAVEELHSATGVDVEAGAMHGMMAFGHPENPFVDHSVVFVPYCTADVHIGDSVTTYTVDATEETPAHDVTIHHRGYVNAMAALDWTYEQFLAPESILVTGSSAGAIPSPLYARFLAEHYPDTRLAALGDGAGGYRNLMDADRPHEKWDTLAALSDLPEFSSMVSEEFTFESLYTTSGTSHPYLDLARYDTSEDSTQKRFLNLGGVEVSTLQPFLDANHADIAAQVENYVSYVAPGELHTILLRPEFYTYQVDGVSVRDWVADFAAGVSVDDVHCGSCDAAALETTTP